MFINMNIIQNQTEEVLTTEIIDGKVVVTSQIVASMSESDLLRYKSTIQSQQLSLKNQMNSVKENYDKLTANMAIIDGLLANFEDVLPTIPE